MSAALVRSELPAIEVSRVASPLVRDYLAGAPALAPFYSGHPDDPGAYRRKAAEVDARLGASERGRVADAIRPLSDVAAGKLARVLAGDGYFVTTGQQAGLFTGPLYTIYKALSAIRLASELERLLGRPVLALFWSAADDHDWDEVSHTSVIDRQNYVQRIALGTDPDAPAVAMSHRPIARSAAVALDELRAALDDTEHRDRLLLKLRAAYAPGRTMAAAFEEALAAVLEGQDIALVSSAHPLVKRHSAGVLARALTEHDAQEAAVTSQTARLESAGYRAQVALAGDASNVFAQTAEARDRLVREGGAWVLRRTRRRFSEGELLAWLEREPAAFSPNVLLRPVVESALFPTLAYVGGPAETSYFAQVGCLFLAHGIMPPVAVPRHSVTLVEPRVKRALEKQGLVPADVRQPFEALVARLVKEEMPAEVLASLAALRRSLDERFGELAEAALEVDERLRGPLAGARNSALAQARELERRIEQHLRLRNRVRFEQLRKTAANLFPADAPQERVLNVLPYLARYGPPLLDAVRQAMPVSFDRSEPGYGVKCNGEARLPLADGGIA